jgi:hypothetical protein
LTANQTNLIAIPQRIYYATDDLICVPATATALIANLGANCTGVSLGASGGHSDTSVGVADINDIMTWLAAHA